MIIHVMLDLETLSTQTNAAIVQLAAVTFNPLTGNRVSTSQADSAFNCFVNGGDPGAHIDPATVGWWLQQGAVARELGRAICALGVPMRAALQAFVEWYVGLGTVECIWSHGLTFDVPILTAALERHGLKTPWHYRAPRDTRTLFAHAPGGMPAVANTGRTHDAFNDCEVQIKQVVGALAALREQRTQAELYTGAYALGDSRP